MIQLTRYMSIPNVGTYGKLRIGDLEFATIEREWLQNKPNVSCIPAGIYLCRPHPVKDDRFRLISYINYVYHQSDDADFIKSKEMGYGPRWGINVEPANNVWQIQGCIAIGLRHGYVVGGTLGVVDSRIAVTRLMSKLRIGKQLDAIIHIKYK